MKNMVARVGIRRIAVLIACFIVAAILFVLWKPSSLERPETPSPNTMRVGIGDAPADTRVLLELNHWSRGEGMGVVLGQSEVASEPTAFRIELSGFLVDDDGADCQGTYEEGVCWYGSADVDVLQDGPDITISGTFDPDGFARLDFSKNVDGASENGPYRAVYAEVFPLVGQNRLAFPARGVEVHVFPNAGDTPEIRYDSIITPPGRLYVDGWAWIFHEPGGVIGVQTTLVDEETRIRSTADVAGLLLGVVIALVIQLLLESYLPRRRAEEAGADR